MIPQDCKKIEELGSEMASVGLNGISQRPIECTSNLDCSKAALYKCSITNSLRFQLVRLQCISWTTVPFKDLERNRTDAVHAANDPA